MFDKQKYHDAIDTLAEQLVQLIIHENPTITYGEALEDEYTYVLVDMLNSLDDEVERIFEENVPK